MQIPDVILLLSGGIDSTTLLAQLTAEGKRVHALSMHYGQRHAIELEYARRNAQLYQVAEHHVIRMDLAPMAEGNLLTGTTTTENQTEAHYVPGRNMLLLSHAAAYAEAKGISDIYLAANADDGLRFPDCSMAFLDALNQLWQSCPNTAGIKVHSPFISLSKAAVVAKSLALGVQLEHTMSCYAPAAQQACGKCLSCQLRQEAMEYVNQMNIG